MFVNWGGLQPDPAAWCGDKKTQEMAEMWGLQLHACCIVHFPFKLDQFRYVTHQETSCLLTLSSDGAAADHHLNVWKVILSRRSWLVFLFFNSWTRFPPLIPAGLQEHQQPQRLHFRWVESWKQTPSLNLMHTTVCGFRTYTRLRRDQLSQEGENEGGRCSTKGGIICPVMALTITQRPAGRDHSRSDTHSSFHTLGSAPPGSVTPCLCRTWARDHFHITQTRLSHSSIKDVNSHYLSTITIYRKPIAP